MRYTAAIIGTGPDPEETDRTGYAMAYRHAPGYQRLDNVELVACADIVRENVEAFAEHFDIAEANVYEDYEVMLEELDPDIVSVCTPPWVHADIVVGAARTGVPEAIHCEKPMATTVAALGDDLARLQGDGVNLRGAWGSADDRPPAAIWGAVPTCKKITRRGDGRQSPTDRVWRGEPLRRWSSPVRSVWVLHG
jgi:hypothetical protein